MSFLGGLIGSRPALVAQVPPDELIPGDPSATEADAGRVNAVAAKVRDTGADLAGIKPHWRGDGGTAYRPRQAKNVAGWDGAAAKLSDARSALLRFSDALSDAKSTAGTAVDQFEAGLALAAKGAAEERERLAKILPIPFTAAPSRAELDARPEGRGLRDDAVAMLDEAKQAVQTAGSTAAAALNYDDDLPWSGSDLGGSPPPGTEGDPTGDKISYSPIDGPVPLDDDDLHDDNIVQGQIGDCWFLAGAGAVANADPEWIRQHLHRNADGSYDVTLYKKDGDDFTPVTVHVEGSTIDSGVKDRSGLPSWLSVYEKAAARMRGGDYDDIEGGFSKDSMEMVTGRKADSHDDPSLGEIRRGLSEGRIYSVSTENGDTFNPFDREVDDDRVVPNHAYMIDRVEERDGHTMVHVVNPWGPDGGDLDGHHKTGDLWLTEKQLHESFDDVYSVGRK